MKPLALLLLVLIACGSIRHTQHHGDTEDAGPEHSCECTEVVEELRVEVNECRKEVASEKKKPHVRTRVKIVEKAGPPKKCATGFPKIEPVKTVECKPGFVCVDPDNQRTWALNELAYRKWARAVVDCEDEK